MNKLFQDEVWYKMPEYPVVVGDNIKIEYKGNAGEAVTTAIAAGDPPEAASNISYAQLAIKDVFLDTQPLVDTSKYITRRSLDLQFKSKKAMKAMFGQYSMDGLGEQIAI